MLDFDFNATIFGLDLKPLGVIYNFFAGESKPLSSVSHAQKSNQVTCKH